MWALSVPLPFIMPVHAGRRRLLRPARALLHPALGRPDPRRRDRRRQGPQQRAEEPLRPPAQKTDRRVGAGLADAVGPDPVRRDLPLLGRRLRAGDRRRGHRGVLAATRPGSTAPRCAPSRPRPPSATRSTRRPAARRRPRSGSRPGSPTRSRRSTRPRSTCRSRGSSRCGSRTSASPPRARAGSSPRPARPAWTASCRSTAPAACSPPTRSAPPACSASPRRRCRSAARPATTRSTGYAARSATPTAAARSSSRCGSSGSEKPSN